MINIVLALILPLILIVLTFINFEKLYSITVGVFSSFYKVEDGSGLGVGLMLIVGLLCFTIGIAWIFFSIAMDLQNNVPINTSTFLIPFLPIVLMPVFMFINWLGHL